MAQDTKDEIDDSLDEAVETEEITAIEELDIDQTAEMAEEDLVTALRAEVRENFDKYLRSVAELENYKKRVIKERSELLKYAGENIARDLLEVVDNLERAVTQAPPEGGAFVEGVQLVLSSFLSILDRHGIRGESCVGQQFDPSRQAALATVPTADVPPGTVLEQFRKLYFYKDKLLRPAQVVVSAQLPQTEE